jgi:hypothetical protein
MLYSLATSVTHQSHDIGNGFGEFGNSLTKTKTVPLQGELSRLGKETVSPAKSTVSLDWKHCLILYSGPHFFPEASPHAVESEYRHEFTS